MRKKLLLIMLAAALITASSSFEVLALTNSSDDLALATEAAEEGTELQTAGSEDFTITAEAEEQSGETQTSQEGETGTEEPVVEPEPEEKPDGPAAVKNLKALAGKGIVVLQWKKNSDAESYTIKRSLKKKSGYKTIKTVKTNTYTDKSVKDDKTYYYRIYSNKKGTKNNKFSSVKGGSIRTIHYKITFSTTRTLTSHTGGHKKHTFKRGYTTTAFGFTTGRYTFLYKGRVYYVMKISVMNARVKNVNAKVAYSKAEVERLVNKQLKLTSKTKYLIYVNTYSQKEYILKGSKGKWKVIHGPIRIATGKASTPTSMGRTMIHSKSISENGLPYWSMTVFFSFHGLPGGAKVDYPTSGACVRNYDNWAKWIYYNCAWGTGVYIY